MTMCTSVRRGLTVGVAAALVALSGMSASAQPSGGKPPQQNAAVEQSTREPLVTVDFKGGTVQQYIAALRGAMGKDPVNAVVSESASKAELAAIVLSRVPLSAAMQAISAAAGSSQGNWSIKVIPTESEPSGASLAYAIDFLSRGQRPNEDMVIETYSLARLIKPGKENGPGVPSSVVLSAVETGLRMQTADGKAPELKFHEDSGLLFVRGTVPDVRLVGSVVARMSDDADRESKAAARHADAERERAMAVKEAELNIQMREIELQSAMQVLDETEQLVKGGSAPAPELNAAKAAARKAQIRLEEAKLGRERALMVGSPDSWRGGGGGGGGDSSPQASREELLNQIAAMQKRINDLEAAQKGGGKSPTR